MLPKLAPFYRAPDTALAGISPICCRTANTFGSIHGSAALGNVCAAVLPGRKTQGLEYFMPCVGHR